MNPILIVDNEEKFCKVIKSALELENIPSEYVLSGEAALQWLKDKTTDIVLTDLRMDGMDGLELLRHIKEKNPKIEVLIMTAFATQKTAVDALKMGAFDYLIKPFEMDELILRIRRILNQLKLLQENRRLKTATQTPIFFENLVGRSEKMRRVYHLIQKAAETDSTVLIRGESGTGKEKVAETIHKTSKRKDRAFVAINCAALPENLLESELFGYEKGAFTGATQRKIGKFELAHHGTLFLDEIGDMSPSIQAKLLRVLEEKAIYRLGGNERIPVDTRIIAATHRNLEELVAQGEFRQDLYYRLNIFPIHLPPLRERKEDIPALVNHFLNQTGALGIEKEALKKLMEYDWPGNVRELLNVIERASILAENIITVDDLPPLPGQTDKRQSAFDFEIPPEGFQLDAFEKFLVQQALQKTAGNKTRAAQLLGITRRRLYSLMERFGIEY